MKNREGYQNYFHWMDAWSDFGQLTNIIILTATSLLPPSGSHDRCIAYGFSNHVAPLVERGRYGSRLSFFRLFRANFKQATVIWLTCLGLSALLYLDYCLSSNTALLSEYKDLDLLPFIVLLCGGMTLIFPYIGLFPEDPTRKVCLNSFLIALLNQFQAIFLIFFNLTMVISFLVVLNELHSYLSLYLWRFRLVELLKCSTDRSDLFKKIQRRRNL